MNVSVERGRVEMHILAYVYHWDRNTIMTLSRGERRRWYDIIMEQKKVERKAAERANSK